MQQLTAIKQKLQQLLKQYQQLQKENGQLKETLQKQSDAMLQQTKTITDLQIKLNAAQINQSTLSHQDKQALEKKINNYIKDIETSLALLNKE